MAPTRCAWHEGSPSLTAASVDAIHLDPVIFSGRFHPAASRADLSSVRAKTSRLLRGQGVSLLIAGLLHLTRPLRLSAADHFEIKHELYREDAGRVEVSTSTFLIEKALGSSLVAKGQMVYDTISGATPTGGPPPTGSDRVPLASIEDIRRAGTLELAQRLGRHTLAPQVAYSIENDYESYGLSLSDSFEFNNRNTVVTLGLSRIVDRVLNANTPYVGQQAIEHKYTTDVMLGMTQLLGPKTILTANATIGTSDGYLTDPYKGIHFDAADPFFGPGYLFGENRPRHRTRQVVYASLKQFFTKADASAELSYRLHRDSFGICAHTIGLTWHQKLGKYLSLQPSLRYHDQTGAEYYFASVPGSLGFPLFPGPSLPKFYSADYRLSSLHSWTYGIKATLKAHDRVWFEIGYKRYVMEGDDPSTAGSQYPQANVVTGGLLVWF